MKTDNLTRLDDMRPCINAKALCLNMVYKHNATMPCFKQWIATCPEETNLTKLECPECGAQNSFAVGIVRGSTSS